jgi:beta-glucosidase
MRLRLHTILAGALFTASWSISNIHAEEEICMACDKKVFVTGQFRHASRDNAVIEGVPGREAAFREEIRGTNFTVTVPNLAEGKYTVEIGAVEVHFDAPGVRLFHIVGGDRIVATNLDLFVAAGGMSKAHLIRMEVEHPGDALRGPLTFQFIARENNAKLNTFEVKDAAGTSIVFMKASDLVTVEDEAALAIPTVTGPMLWKDHTQPLQTRIRDLISRMSLSEKAAQMRNKAPAIPRIGLPAYDYWNECLHGVGRAGVATVFPQAIGMAATWDVPLFHEIADAIATEGRAKHHQYTRENNGDSGKYFGLTFWTPNINIFRDPRWGRGQETYGEDPFLTARLGVSFIKGLQGDDPKYVKAMACAKHFVVHSGPEPARHTFDVAPSERDFYETYLPHFEAAVKEGKVWSVMGAYNRVYAESACSSPFLLTDILRTRWGFQGHVVSDCGAIYDIFANHKIVATAEEAAARAVRAGCDLCCGTDYGALTKAVRKGLITEQEMDVSLGRLLEARFRLGLFDPVEQVAYAQIPIEKNDSAEHHALSLRTAQESMVLLKNDGVLPFNRKKIKRIAVIGTNASSVPMLLGNYNGIPSKPITILEGIRTVAGNSVEVTYHAGVPLAVRKDDHAGVSPEMLQGAIEAAKAADVVIYVGGLSPRLEGEEMRVDYNGFAGGDRTEIELPAVQRELLKALRATGRPIVLVNCSGSAVAMEWEAKNLNAILQAWYPGGSGGRAVADVLFGDVNPSGRLPVTFYRSVADLPPFEDYSMSNRTYRYFEGKPLYAFGHGLSYTTYRYGKARLNQNKARATDTVKLKVDVRNTGSRAGEEVVQVYFRHLKPKEHQARLTLCGFAKVSLQQKSSASVTFDIPVERFRHWDTAKKDYAVELGSYEFLVGGASDKLVAKALLQVH